MNYQRVLLSITLAFLSSVFGSPAGALVISEDFTQATTTHTWLVPAPSDGGTNSVCLTAGSSGAIPQCASPVNTAGNGALQLTNNTNNKHGAIVSNFTFPSNDGVKVVFTTYTYGGSGADGIVFFLSDALAPVSMGGTGGSLAYSCSNVNAGYDGVSGGYIGLGMDEYGNFLNAPDNTTTGNGFQANRIGLRGAGNINWAYLNNAYPATYLSGDNAATKRTKVNWTCANGQVYGTSNNLPNTLLYKMLPGGWVNLPGGTPIGSNATTRASAVPITYKLNITTAGLLSLSYSYNGGTYQSVITDYDISVSNGTVPANFRFGFTGSTGGLNNYHDITCFQATPGETTASSASLNIESGQIKTGTQVYLAYYHPTKWWGTVTSQDLTYNSANNTVTIASLANWDANCSLTGGNCANTNATGVVAQTPTSREILTYDRDTSAGIPFRWASLPTSTNNMQTPLNNDAQGSNRLDYLRGVRTHEMYRGGSDLFRVREGVLGDIIDSSPTWVGPPSAPYPSTDMSIDSVWDDLLYTTTPIENAGTPQTYKAFQTAKNTRQNNVFIGSNDGMLHAFRSGSYDSTGLIYSSTNNDGREVLAYMPHEVEKIIHDTSTAGYDYSAVAYGHNYYVDATPGVGDLYYNNAWHTWLIGGLGPGGKAIFALDITDPTTFSEANASTIVKGEWNSTDLTNLGKTYGTPQIRRFHSNQWGAVFGNGIDSANGVAGIYVMLVDASTGSISFRFLTTATGNSTTKNGIAYVTPVDFDGDYIVDYVYAGDVYGKVWRFDLTDETPSNWTVTGPIFSTPANQPITTKVVVGAVKTNASGSTYKIMLMFGTGQKTPQNLTASAAYATTTQSIYGVWDWQMTAWNALSTVEDFEYLSSGANPVLKANLRQQTLTASSTASASINGASGYRTVSANAVCWQGGTGCGSNDKYGWYIDLDTVANGTGNVYEQVIYSPVLESGILFVNTTIPEINYACTAGGTTGYTMALNPATGAASTTSVFGVTANGNPVVGLKLNATGSPTVAMAQGNAFLINQTTTGAANATAFFPSTGSGTRLNWIQLR